MIYNIHINIKRMKNIHKYTYPFAAGKLKITTIGELTEQIKADIGFLIRIIENQLNPKVLDSSAYKIKHAQKGFEVLVEEEMIVYLKFCFDLEKNFGITTLSRESEEFPVLINEENTSVKKIHEFTFVNEDLKKYFLINMIKVFLSERKVKDFLIESSIIKYSTPNKLLKANFDLIGSAKNLDLAVNGWTYHYEIQNQKKEVKSKFAYQASFVQIKEVIFIGKDFLEVFKNKDEIAEFNTLEDLKSYRGSSSFAFIVITTSDEVLYF